MHGPVDGEVSRSSRSSPSIAPTLPRRADPDRPLLQGFRVRLRVEPDEQRPANPERRRPEGASGPQQEREQLRPGWPGRLEIQVDSRLASGDPDLVDVPRHGQRGLAGDRRLPCVHLLHTVHRLLRKGAHLTEYAILAALWYRAFTRERNLSARAASWTAFAISLAWAALDEWHQSFLPSRTSSAMDVALDGAGAALALVVDWRAWRGMLDGATAILLWLAAVGGAAVIAMNAWTGVPSGTLWVTTPAAGLLLLARSRLRRLKRDASGSGDGGGREALRDP